MRPVRACTNCRIRRRKCRSGREGRECDMCARFGLLCSSSTSAVAPTRKQTTELRPNPRLRTSTSTTMELSPAEQRQCVNKYFQYIHETHHSLFHWPSFMSDFSEGRVPEVVLLCMVSLGARFVAAPEDRGAVSQWYADRASQMLDITDISLSTVQACILLGTVYYAAGETRVEALYYALANRLAMVLDLPNRRVRNELDRQVNLRVWWTLYMIDIWSSTGVGLPRQLDLGSAPLPMEENGFMSLRADDTQATDNITVNAPGIQSEMVRLSRIWAQIHVLHSATVRHSLEDSTLRTEIDAIAGELESWSRGLPTYLKETDENLQDYAERGFGAAFAALHLGYHYYNQVLYYQFLARQIDSPSLTNDVYAQRCKSHAAKFCQLLYATLSHEEPPRECLYVMVGHMLVVTSTVYIHILLFSANPDQVSLARERLQHNFTILTRLQEHWWATLEVCLSRLSAFHNACCRSFEHSFEMDRWMLRFLLAHGTRIDERFASYGGTVSEALYTESSPESFTHRTSPSLTLQDWYKQTFSS